MLCRARTASRALTCRRQQAHVELTRGLPSRASRLPKHCATGVPFTRRGHLQGEIKKMTNRAQSKTHNTSVPGGEYKFLARSHYEFLGACTTPRDASFKLKFRPASLQLLQRVKNSALRNVKRSINRRRRKSSSTTTTCPGPKPIVICYLCPTTTSTTTPPTTSSSLVARSSSGHTPTPSRHAPRSDPPCGRACSPGLWRSRRRRHIRFSASAGGIPWTVSTLRHRTPAVASAHLEARASVTTAHLEAAAPPPHREPATTTITATAS